MLGMQKLEIILTQRYSQWKSMKHWSINGKQGDGRNNQNRLTKSDENNKRAMEDTLRAGRKNR